MSGIVARKQYPEGYPNDALDILKTMSFTDGRNVNVVGSMALRSQVYAGDYDADEVVDTRGSKDHSVRGLVRKFKSIIRELLDKPLTYIGDIKSGSIEEWKVFDESYNSTASRKKLRELRNNRVITEKEYIDGLKLLKPRLSKIEFLLVQQKLRFHIIRWKPSEVLDGHKILTDGRKFTLEEAFQTPTITKLDVVSWVQNSRFTDFSMIYQFKHGGKLLNPGLRDFEESIRENIYVLKHDGNYFKMAKRMFALARFNNHQKEIELLSTMFNSDMGRLYQVYGDIGTIESLVENTSSLPYSRIEFEIDQFKGRLSNIGLPKYLEEEGRVFELIDELINMRKSTYTKEKLLGLLETLKKRLYELLTYYAKQYLQLHKLSG
jgi:hypothetical protein